MVEGDEMAWVLEMELVEHMQQDLEQKVDLEDGPQMHVQWRC